MGMRKQEFYQPNKPRKLLDQVRDVMRLKHYAYRTEITYSSWINAVRSQKKQRLPVVMRKEETQRVLMAMTGTTQLMAKLLYGSGLRLMECIRLRVKDIDFEINEIRVRSGKGDKDRLVPLPKSIKPALKMHLERVKLIHDLHPCAAPGSTGS